VAADFQYVKAYICECGCAWTIVKQDPEVCWACNSHGPHSVVVTCHANPKFMAIINDYEEDFLFSDVPDMEE
jgi:hypothetical protein